MAGTRRQAHAKKQYRKPVIQKVRKLADVTESPTVVTSGQLPP